MRSGSTFRRVAGALGVLVAATALGASGAFGLSVVPAAGGDLRQSHGDLLQLLKPGVRANTSRSSNWFGYNQGSAEQGGKSFHSIGGDWTVPRARQHQKGRSESSSVWIGIGGGCVDAGCDQGDLTLIQTGTEQDVSGSGRASYSAWWEIIPGPSMTIPNMRIRPGDHMRASIVERPTGSELWRITLRDLTRHRTFSKTVPYPSTHATAEWIEETPVVIGANAGLADLPNLSRTRIHRARVNGSPAHLVASERLLLASQGKVIGSPSAPDRQRDGFAACAWASRCPAPR